MRLISFLCLLLLATPVLAASFNCSKAATPQEKAICASPKLSAADDHMAAAYRAILRAVPPLFQDELRADQRVWIRRLAADCPADNREQRQYLETCLLGRENARADALKQRFFRQNGVSFAWHSFYLETPGDPDDTDPGEGPGSIEVSWPEALSGSPEWAAWNRAVAQKTLSIAGLAMSNAPIPARQKWEASPGMDAIVSASLDFINSRQVSATITSFWDGHGAHPSTHWFQFNWLLPEKRNLLPTDIFRADSLWTDRLYSATDQYLRGTLDDYDPAELSDTLHAITANPENWQINGKGISIVFQQYAVACYACTPEPFLIPWTQLRPLLNPAFIPPDSH